MDAGTAGTTRGATMNALLGLSVVHAVSTDTCRHCGRRIRWAHGPRAYTATDGGRSIICVAGTGHWPTDERRFRRGD